MTKMLASLTLLAASLACSMSFAQGQPRMTQFGYERYNNPNLRWTFPPNGMHLMDRPFAPSQINEALFNKIVDDVLKYWQPIAKAKGVELSANKDWKDGTVNASAEQTGRSWVVNMYGGLARRPEVTPDGFAMVVCHELGHHFAGYAFYDNSSWAANEGQSDYFATTVCAKVIWSKDFGGNDRFRHMLNLPATVQNSCAAAYPNNANAQGWCVRTAAAGQSLANLLAALGGSRPPSVDTPDKSVVRSTQSGHPAAQCRLDTYFAGALCNKPWDMNVIPGRSNPKGQMSAAAEMESMKTSCYAKQGDQMGTRPLCWFKPLVN